MARPSDSVSSGWIEVVVGLLSLAGLADSILLTVEHYKAIDLPCTFTKGCETVLTSQWAQIGSLPISLIGVMFYSVLLFVVIYSISNQKQMPRKFLLGWATLGILSSAWLTFLQAVMIRAWCQYCLLSALSATLIFACAVVAYRMNPRADQSEPVHDIEEETNDDEEEA